MPVKSKKTDRRASRTRRSLSDALIELILEKRYDSITVQNVIDRADVGRSTFYAHYRDKDDLFLSGWQELLDACVRHIQWQNVSAGKFFPVHGLFQHVQEFHQLYRALARSRKTDLLFKAGPGYLTKSIENSLNSLLTDKSETSVPIPILSNYLAAGILDLLKWWLDHEMPHSPERMDEIFHKLFMPGLRAVLGDIEWESPNRLR